MQHFSVLETLLLSKTKHNFSVGTMPTLSPDCISTRLFKKQSYEAYLQYSANFSAYRCLQVLSVVMLFVHLNLGYESDTLFCKITNNHAHKVLFSEAYLNTFIMK